MSCFATTLLDWVRANNVQRFRNELALNRALNNAFGGSPKGRKYPTSCYSGTCDFVVPTSPNAFRWVEVKYAQTYFSQAKFRRNNLSLFEKHVFSALATECSVRNDFSRKLDTLVGNQAVDHIGMLVVFLYSKRYPLPEDTIPRLDAIAPASLWRKNQVPAWQNPDHELEPSWVLPVYWERSRA